MIGPQQFDSNLAASPHSVLGAEDSIIASFKAETVIHSLHVGEPDLPETDLNSESGCLVAASVSRYSHDACCKYMSRKLSSDVTVQGLSRREGGGGGGSPADDFDHPKTLPEQLVF